MTDYFMLAALWAAAFWVLDPLRIGLDRITIVKHLPLMLMAGTAAMVTVGITLFAARDRSEPFKEVMARFWPLALFGLGVIGGSLFGRLVNGVDNSFLNMGLFVWVVPLVAWAVVRSPDPAAWARGFFLALGSVAVLVGLLQWVHYGNGMYYHGVEFAVIPFMVYCWYASRHWPTRLLGLLFFLSLAVAQHKNTGYMLALYAFAHISYWAWRAGYRAARDVMARERQVGWAAFLVMGAAAFGLGFWGLREIFLPSGNPDYRLHTYQKALEKFADSPLVGNLFTGPATERFELYQVNVSSTNVLPTHSDPLDILGNGGLLYAVLFVWGCWLLLRLMMGALEAASAQAQAMRRARRPAQRLDAPQREVALDEKQKLRQACMPALHGCLAIFIGGLIVLCFNPVLTQPNSALVYWAATGLGLGLALRMRPDQARFGAYHPRTRARRPGTPRYAPRMMPPAFAAVAGAGLRAEPPPAGGTGGTSPPPHGPAPRAAGAA
jgi:hypothetical protein